MKNIYFYYDSKKKDVYMDENIPKSISLHELGVIHWRQYDIKVHILCSNSLLTEPKTWLQDKKNCSLTKKKHIPILKSNLQKTIRRGLDKQAVKTAFTMLCIDPNQLLRRLPIIMIEDVGIHNDFIFLTWIMCASSKKLELPDSLVLRIMSIVSNLCMYPKKQEYQKMYNYLDVMKCKLQNFTDKHHVLLWSLELRRSYGGMKGDMCMINWYAYHIYHKKIQPFTYEKETKLEHIKDMKLISKQDIQLSSIDFHCCDILYRLQHKFPKFPSYIIKKMMWDYRSSINFRVIRKPNILNKNWKHIESEVDGLSQDIINELF